MWKNRTARLPGVAMKLTIGVLLTVLLSGCGSLTKSNIPAIHTWWLVPIQANSVAAASPDASTAVLVNVEVIPGLDTADILTLSPNAELSRFTGARWADELPELLRSLTGRSLASTGQYDIVSRRDSPNLHRCQLRLQVKAFYAELSGSGIPEDVRIAMSAEYYCKNKATRRVLEFDKRIPVNADKMGTIVAAFQSGLNQAMTELSSQMQQAD